MKYEDRFPLQLKQLPIWVLWRIEEDPKGRATKIPYSPHYNGRASSINPNTWGSFDQALRKYESRPDYYKGLGIVVSKDYGLVFIDVDHCVDPDGVLNDTAWHIVSAFQQNQFAELSQSGSGIHIITRGTIPKNFKNSGDGVEMYAEKRFCALTGNILFKGEPIEEQSVLDALFQRYKTPDKVKKRARAQSVALNHDDNWVISHAREHGRFSDLYFGNWNRFYSSQSEGDLSLCLILAFWTDCDADQIDRIFRSSGLYRDKWDQKHHGDGSTYGELTIQTAIDQCEETVSDYRSRMNHERGDKLDRALREQWD